MPMPPPSGRAAVSTDDERVIELSRAKLAMVVAGALAMAAAGVWFVVADDDSSLIVDLGRFVDPWVVHALGAVAVLVFGGLAVYGAAKSFDRKPGLVLGPAGLTDNSSAASAGFVPWSEVVGLGIFEFQRQRMLVVHVADPQKYIDRGSAIRRSINRANAGMCGTPIVISSTALRIPFEELQQEVGSYASRYAPPQAEGPGNGDEPLR